ncbi:MAG: FG-GAP-like repeat-containing protein [Patescibacteria group bacterium]
MNKKIIFLIVLIFGAFIPISVKAASVTNNVDDFIGTLAEPRTIQYNRAPYFDGDRLFNGTTFQNILQGVTDFDSTNSITAKDGVVISALAYDLGYPKPAGYGDNLLAVDANGIVVSDHGPFSPQLTLGFVTKNAQRTSYVFSQTKKIGIQVTNEYSITAFVYNSAGEKIETVQLAGSTFYGITLQNNANFIVLQFAIPQGAGITGLVFEHKGMEIPEFVPLPVVSTLPDSDVVGPSDKTGIIVASNQWEAPYVRVFSNQGEFIREFLVYEKEYLGGINLSIGDITLDGKADIVVSPVLGRMPEVKIYSVEGNLINSFLAYDESFGGGINIAIGDVDGNGIKEIITGAGVGGHLVKVFTYRDGQYQLMKEFSAYNYNYLLGVKVAAGDLDGDGKSEIITGTESGGGPHVRVFDGNGNLKFSPGFFAYREDLRHGIKVACGDLDGDGRDEIITGTNIRMGPHVRVFDPFGNIKFTPGFFAYDNAFRGGVNVAVADLNQDGRDEIITGAGPGGGPHIRIFNRYGDTIVSSGFFAYPMSYRSGVQVGGGIIE